MKTKTVYFLEVNGSDPIIFEDIELAYDFVVKEIKDNFMRSDAEELIAELHENIAQIKAPLPGSTEPRKFNYFYIDDMYYCYEVEYIRRENNEN